MLRVGRVHVVNLKPVGLERLLVDLDARGRARRGQVEHPAAQLALGRGDRRGEEALGGEAVGEPGSSAPAVSRSVWATCAAAAIPTGPSSALET